MEIVLKPIGYVRTSLRDEEIRSVFDRSSVRGYIEVLPEYSQGLRGLEGFSHVIIIAYLHKVPYEARSTLLVKPRRLVKLGLKPEELPEVGVFATDSPHRPNPIALTIVELEKIEEDRLYVRGLDLYDGTPVLDIKPYDKGRSIVGFRIPEWLRRLEEKVREKTGLDITP
ncbi:tRNA (N6-threonylcarbamoyladenosine(37)-N6)-methyltransferase TrmO [Desulfurococcus mucosus]|uniref:tRNA (N6-threonylcarbamoyladenosine(37)-N6)-methyltransferase TrmO n=1 Tax=Desulfurococcus mucosus TaxID=2275 RepID=UPI00064FBDC9|nr:tRNA (N6-threonylcarbamoyladenosine(37)-N6)-methyltransferase TrmO [Desulfurococcus mucosus]